MEFAVEQLLSISFDIEPFASEGVALVGYVGSSPPQDSIDEGGVVAVVCTADVLLSLSFDFARVDENDGESGDAMVDPFPSIDIWCWWDCCWRNLLVAAAIAAAAAAAAAFPPLNDGTNNSLKDLFKILPG